ncbi:MAG TPA: acyltransferase, partial [Chthonomonadaceae bacterium]|nr:acyltransferase [Chthonomonadaceae bacterium]
KGWTRFVLVHNLLSVLIAVPTLLWAVHRFGPIGACAVWMGVNAGYLLVMTPILHARLLHGELRRWILEDTLAPGAAALLAAWLVRLSFPASPTNGIGLLSLLLGAGGLALTASLLAASRVRTALWKLLQPRLTPAQPIKPAESETRSMRSLTEEHSLPSSETQTAVVVQKQASQREHFAYLDGLRAAAALYVVLHHAWLHLQLPSGWTTKLTFWLQFGHFAVDVFIVLSGFCLMLPVVRGDGTLRGGVKGFFQRRARRIMPPYYFAVALSLVLIWTVIGSMTGTHWDVSLPAKGRDILMHLLLLQDVQPLVDGAKINHPLWSVAVEWHIYFLFPLLVLLWRRYGGIRAAAVTTLLSYIAGVVAVRTAFLEGMHFQYIGLFALGMLGATVAFSPQETWSERRERLPWAGVAASALLLALVCGVVWRHVHGITIYVDPLIGVSASALMIALSRPGPNLLRRIMEWKPLVFVGGFSYSLYLIHAPLLQVVWQYGILPLHRSATVSFWLLATVGTLCIVLASYLFSLACERPFMNLPRRQERPLSASEERAHRSPLSTP